MVYPRRSAALPSTFDTNGLVVREAAACSLGSVLIEGSCAAEGITDGDTGILIPENGDGLAAALLREGADRAYFARIGETASEKIYLSWEDSVKNARAQYRSVIERWNSGDLPRRRVLPARRSGPATSPSSSTAPAPAGTRQEKRWTGICKISVKTPRAFLHQGGKYGLQ